MTDIFREVEEEVRRERIEQLWKKYGDYIIAGVALILIAVAGFELWRVHEKNEKAKASTTYAAAGQMLEAGAATSAAATYAKLAETAPSGYAQLALMQKANSLLSAGNIPEAVETYKQVAAKGDPLLAPVARIRAGWATVESGSRGDLDALLKPLLEPSSPWHPMAQEIIAYADYRAGATAKALGEFKSIADDHDAPQAVRQRSNVMATYLAAGGDRNYGTVPPPPKPQPAQTPEPAQGAKPQ